MKKVLIITYYWPPAGGGGVQRWLKMHKYFRENNWEPIIFTAENGEAPFIDNSLLKDVDKDVKVLKKNIWEPYKFYKKFTGKKKSDKIYSGFIQEKKGVSLTQKISVWLRGNFFIPDARKYWIKPATKYIVEYIKDNPVDAIISTGPPHSINLIGLGVKKNTNLPWIADFRDPWTDIDFYHELMLTSFADRKHKRLEKEVLKNADKSVTVSWSWAKTLGEKVNTPVEVITNGFDHLDFQNKATPLTKKFTIAHIGSMNKDRNTPSLWNILSDLCSDESFKKDLEIVLIGNVDYSVQESIKNKGLYDNLNIQSAIPHKEIIKKLPTFSCLLLPINNTPNLAGVIPGKLYEYLGAKRPIVCIGPKNGDAAKVINLTQGGKVFDYENEDDLKTYVLNLYHSMNDNSSMNSINIEQFTRQNLAKKYCDLLDDITQK